MVGIRGRFVFRDDSGDIGRMIHVKAGTWFVILRSGRAFQASLLLIVQWGVGSKYLSGV